MTANLADDLHLFDRVEFVRMKILVETDDGGNTWQADTPQWPELRATGNSKGRAAIALLGLIAKQLEQEESDDV